MSTFSIDTNQVVECGKRIVSISDDALSNAMTIVENARAELSRYSINVDANIQHIMECLGIQKRNVTSLGASARYIAMHYRMAENAIRMYGAPDGFSWPGEDDSNDGDDNTVRIHEPEPMTWNEMVLNLLDQEWITLTGLLSVLSDLSGFFDAAALELLWNIDFSSFSIDTDAMLQWLYAYIPTQAHDSSVVAAFVILSLINHPSARTIENHYNQNLEEWGSIPHTGYIDDQGALESLAYGGSNVGDAGCGLVATYNALYRLNGECGEISMPDIVRSYETNGIALNGMAGTSPLAIDVFFEAEGYDTTMLVGDDINRSSLRELSGEYDTFIMLTYENGNDIRGKLHYICIVENAAGEYVIYNGGESKPYKTLRRAVRHYNNSQAEPIAIIGIG